jgi:hypothetical protein
MRAKRKDPCPPTCTRHDLKGGGVRKVATVLRGAELVTHYDAGSPSLGENRGMFGERKPGLPTLLTRIENIRLIQVILIHRKRDMMRTGRRIIACKTRNSVSPNWRTN